MGGSPGHVSVRKEESHQCEGAAGRQADLQIRDVTEEPGETHETVGTRCSEYPRYGCYLSELLSLVISVLVSLVLIPLGPRKFHS